MKQKYYFHQQSGEYDVFHLFYYNFYDFVDYLEEFNTNEPCIEVSSIQEMIQQRVSSEITRNKLLKILETLQKYPKLWEELKNPNIREGVSEEEFIHYDNTAVLIYYSEETVSFVCEFMRFYFAETGSNRIFLCSSNNPDSSKTYNIRVVSKDEILLREEQEIKEMIDFEHEKKGFYPKQDSFNIPEYADRTYTLFTKHNDMGAYRSLLREAERRRDKEFLSLLLKTLDMQEEDLKKQASERRKASENLLDILKNL